MPGDAGLSTRGFGELKQVVLMMCSQAFAAVSKRVEEASEGAAEAEARRRAMQAELRELAATLEVRSRAWPHSHIPMLQSRSAEVA